MNLPLFKIGYIADITTPNRTLFTWLPDFNIPGTEKSLNEYLEFDVEKIVFSHSAKPDPLIPGGKEDIQFVLDYIKVKHICKTKHVS